MIVTIQKWKYNNDWHKIDKYSERITYHIQRGTAAACMKEIQSMRDCNNIAKFSPWEIVNIQD